MSETNEPTGITPPPVPPIWSAAPESRSNIHMSSSQGQSDKSLLIAAILSGLFFFTALGGIHRFYVGKTGTGILMLLTLGGLGIWAIIDLIRLVTGNFRDENGNKITNWQFPIQ